MTTSGIGTLLERSQQRDPLETLLRAALAEVPPESSLADRFTDPLDRRNAHQRAILCAVLDAIFQHGFNAHAQQPDGSILLNTDSEGYMTILAVVQRAFQHDVLLLDNGFPAQLLLRPAGQEAVEGKRPINATRRTLLLGLLLVEIWERRAADQRFRKKKDVMAFVAQAVGFEMGTIKSYRTYLSKGRRFSSDELDFYRKLMGVLRAQGEKTHPFNQLLPAFCAICEKKPRALNAD